MDDINDATNEMQESFEKIIDDMQDYFEKFLKEMIKNNIPN